MRIWNEISVNLDTEERANWSEGGRERASWLDKMAGTIWVDTAQRPDSKSFVVALNECNS